MISKIYSGSLSLLTDLYQLTMTYGYWKKNIHNKEACFNVFFRESPFKSGYAVCCGLEYVIDFLKNFKFSDDDLKYLKTLKTANNKIIFDDGFLKFLKSFRFKCDVYAVEEGRLVFPNEPILRVKGPLYQCQIIESAIINILNFQTLIATKACRMNTAASGDPILEFGLRRAQGIDGALAASRASYIGGCSSTSNVLAGKIFNIPVSGTHSHSWILSHDSEIEAFRSFSEVMPDNCILLVDTYDTLKGVEKAIEIAKELKKAGKSLLGIRIDSGDLSYLSKKSRKILDKNGFENVKIIASNDIDEFILSSLKQQKAKISVWGIGTKLVTAYDNPSLGLVYKLSAIKQDGNWIKKIKLSEQKIKINNPGILQVHRFINNDKYDGDMIIDELISNPLLKMIDPHDSTKVKSFSKNKSYIKLLVPIFIKGKCVYKIPPILKMKKLLSEEMNKIDNSIKRLQNPHVYKVGLEKKLYEEKNNMIINLRKL
jgi:nicotinate phosphoribosyltransferase